ncbi:hypothetical protein [Roseomonas chloroacetimidivorans]|uniref:hypothetical protein n=1 Tax=Roseomonas chloroacetimidivorans TaxID=1766656 RepID=UPI003C711D5E
MVGITLSQEQIHRAPPEVRRWLQQEVERTLGWAGPAEPPAHVEPTRLVGIGPREARVILSLIEGALPLVAVFFELGRDGGRALPSGLHVFGLFDMTSHARLENPAQVLNCLDIIDRAMAQVSGGAGGTLYGVDDRANCFVAEVTHQSVRQLWQALLVGGALSPAVEPTPVSGQRQPAADVLRSAAGRMQSDGAPDQLRYAEPSTAPDGTAPH